MNSMLYDNGCQVLPVQVEKKTKKGSEVVAKAPDLEEEALKKVEAFYS